MMFYCIDENVYFILTKRDDWRIKIVLKYPVFGINMPLKNINYKKIVFEHVGPSIPSKGKGPKNYYVF